MHYEYSYVLEEGADILAALVSGFPVTLLNIASYVLAALALYTLAQRRGIKHGWMAWLPVVNSWIVGSLSDQYRYVAKGEIKSKRKALLILSILLSSLVTALIVISIVMAVSAVTGFGGSPEALVLPIVGISLVLLGLSIANMVIRYMAMYDIYVSMDPENGVLFLVLSIIFHVTEPFFLFFNRNKDLGMPPRRDAMVPPPVQEHTWQQAEQDPWEKEDKDYL